MDTQTLRTDKASEQIDNGLLRHQEAELVHKEFTTSLDIQLTVVDARKRFLDKLAKIVDPEQKRRIIGNEFISVFKKLLRRLKKLPQIPNMGTSIGCYKGLYILTLLKVSVLKAGSPTTQ